MMKFTKLKEDIENIPSMSPALVGIDNHDKFSNEGSMRVYQGYADIISEKQIMNKPGVLQMLVDLYDAAIIDYQVKLEANT